MDSSISDKVKLIGNNVLVEPIGDEERKFVGIILPDDAKEKPEKGLVVAVGPGNRDNNSNMVPMGVAINDKVYFKRWSSSEVKFGKEEKKYYVVKESDIQLIYKD